MTQVGAIVLVGFAVPGSSSRADTVDLKFGGVADGKVTSKTKIDQIDIVVMDVDDEISVAIPQSRIGRTVMNDQLESYRRAAEAAGDDAEAHYQLALTCRKAGMMPQRTYHHRRVIEIDPDHTRSRDALGYVRSGNKWVKREEQKRQIGMISVGAKWMTPEAYIQQKRRDDFNDATNIWIKKFARLRTTYLKSLKSGKNVDQNLAALQAIDDPHAAKAIAAALEASRGGQGDSVQLRRMYVQKLGSFRNSLAVQALVRCALNDPDDHIRLLAVDQLKQYGASSAVATYLGILKNPEHKRGEVTEALRALNHFPDPELWEDYVDALVTIHITRKAPGPGMQFGQNNQGGGGMQFGGGKPKIIKEPQQNRGAVELLRTVTPGVDFRYDQDGWRRYYAEQLTRAPSDLRRDP